MKTQLVVLSLLLATPVVAQERMRREAPPPGNDRPAAPLTLPTIAFDAQHPFAGVWEGRFSPERNESVPMVVVIEFINGTYSGYQMINNATSPAPHLVVRVAGDSIVWEQRNSGGGFLVYTGRLSGRDAMNGALTFRDLPFESRGHRPVFELRRRASAQGSAQRPALPSMAYDAERPMAGVWEGETRMANAAPSALVVVIEWRGNSYRGYHYSGLAARPAQHLSDRVSGDTLRWEEQHEMGVLLYTAVRTGRDTMTGVMTFRDLPPPPPGRPGPRNPTFTLRRRS